MSDKKIAYLTPAMFQAVVDKCKGSPQKDARGRRYFTFWTAEGQTIVWEGPNEEPS